MKFIEYVQDQTMLFPPSLGELIEKNDICVIINDVVEKIGVKGIENKYVEEGNPAYHPKMMVKLYIYAYARGIRSSRKISQALKENIKFWYLSGKQNPDFRTISDFRKNHICEIRNLFKEVVQLCIDMGMVNLGLVAIDGTKIKANASDRQSKGEDDLKKDLWKIERDISTYLDDADRIDAEEDRIYGRDKRGDEVPEELTDAKKRKERIDQALKKLRDGGMKEINMTDNDAKTMKGKKQYYMAAYNCQTAVDSKSDVIIAAETFSSASDVIHLEDVVESVKENTDVKPDRLVADCGYFSANNLVYLESQGIDSYIPDKTIKIIRQEERGEIVTSQFHKKEFLYDRTNDCYICPENKRLKFSSLKEGNTKGEMNRRYQASGKDCRVCKQFGQCTNNLKGRMIVREAREDLRNAMAKKIRTKKGMSIYGKRMHIAEMPFANIKHNLGFQSFLLRGRVKADGEFKLISMIHNIKMIQGFIKKKLRTNSPPVNWIGQLTRNTKRPEMAMN